MRVIDLSFDQIGKKWIVRIFYNSKELRCYTFTDENTARLFHTAYKSGVQDLERGYIGGEPMQTETAFTVPVSAS